MAVADPILDAREGVAKGLMAARDVIPLTKGGGSFEEVEGFRTIFPVIQVKTVLKVLEKDFEGFLVVICRWRFY